MAENPLRASSFSIFFINKRLKTVLFYFIRRRPGERFPAHRAKLRVAATDVRLSKGTFNIHRIACFPEKALRKLYIVWLGARRLGCGFRGLAARQPQRQ